LAGRLVHGSCRCRLPGDGPGAALNWIWSTWSDDQTALLGRQWDEAIPLWISIAAHARDHGVEQIAFELHPLQLVYNVPTLQRMRDAVGPIIGANLDPSHLFWQQMDPLAVIRVLGEAIFHVHLKDTKSEPERLAIAGVLDQKLSMELGSRPGVEASARWESAMTGHSGRSSSSPCWRSASIPRLFAASRLDEDPYMEGPEGVRDGGGIHAAEAS
jgi:hypothetical protein